MVWCASKRYNNNETRCALLFTCAFQNTDQMRGELNKLKTPLDIIILSRYITHHSGGRTKVTFFREVMVFIKVRKDRRLKYRWSVMVYLLAYRKNTCGTVNRSLMMVPPPACHRGPVRVLRANTYRAYVSIGLLVEYSCNERGHLSLTSSVTSQSFWGRRLTSGAFTQGLSSPVLANVQRGYHELKISTVLCEENLLTLWWLLNVVIFPKHMWYIYVYLYCSLWPRITDVRVVSSSPAHAEIGINKQNLRTFPCKF